MYSDSESESDYNPEYDDTGRVINYQSNSSVSDSDEEFMCSLTTRKKTTGGQRGPKPRGGGGGASGAGRPRRGRGARSNVETNSGNSSRDVPMLVKPPEDMSYGAGSLLEPGIHPPPILIKHQPQDLNNTIAATAATTTIATTAVGEEVRSSAELRVAHLPSVPALVKAPERMGSESNEIEEFDRLTSIGLPSQQQQQHPPHHIQPPPSLVMPSPSSSISTPSIVPTSSSSLSSSPSIGSHQRRREPPPLVRNTDKITTPNSAIELQDSTPHGSRPQIICLSPGDQQQQQLHQRRTPQQAGIPQQGSLSYSIVTQAPQPSYSIVTQQQQTSRNSQLSAISVDSGGRGRGRGRGGGGGGEQQPAPHKPRRPGRPRKDQSVTLSTGLRTSAKTVRLGGGGGGAEGGGGGGGGGRGRGRGGSSARAHYRSGRGGGRAGQNSSQSTKKGMKMTQYEFENVSSSPFPPSLVGGGIPQALQQQQQVQQQQVTAQQQQPQLFQLGSGAAGVAQNLQSLVTPLQIIPAASIPGYHSVSGGGMLLLQNAPQGVTLAAPPSGNDVVAPTNLLGGNTYQLVQAAPMITTDQGENAQKVSVIMHPAAGVGTPVQYIAQFDGPPPKRKASKAPQSRKELHKKFDEERKKEQAKLEQSTTAVTSSKPTKSKSKRSKMTDSDSAMVASGSASTSAEKLMSSELEKYLEVEESRKKRKPSTSTTCTAAAASSSDSGTSRKTKASTATTTRRKKQPDPIAKSPPKNVEETSGTEEEEEEAAGVPEREEEGGEPSSAKMTRTKAKKSLLGKRKSRAKEETQEEDEQRLPPNEEGDPPTSSPPAKQEETKPRDQKEKEEERESEVRTNQAGSEEASEVAMETESPQTSNTTARRGGRGRSKRVKLDSSNQEATEHERTTPATCSSEETLEATMETQTSAAAATSSKRGGRRGRGRGSGTVPASNEKMDIPQLTVSYGIISSQPYHYCLVSVHVHVHTNGQWEESKYYISCWGREI